MSLLVKNISVRLYPEADLFLKNISFSLPRGSILAVVGPNGSGKSTLARALAGLIYIDDGQVSLDGVNGAPRIGMVMQDPAAQAIADTVADDIAWGPERLGYRSQETASKVTQLTNAMNLVGKASANPTHISGGEQQRVASAALLACDIDVLILDEPCAMLDSSSREQLRDVIKAVSQNIPVIWITQVPDDLLISDYTMVLDAGHNVWFGATSQYLSDPAIAATWELELPFMSRIASVLRLEHIPVSSSDLIGMIAGSAGA